MEYPVALVTGAAKRLGACIATTLHRRGYRVIIHYRRSARLANDLVTRLNTERPHSAMALQADLVTDNLQQMARNALQAYGRMDLLVNNASSFYPTPPAQLSDAHWQDLFGTNARAPLMLSCHLAASLRQRRGNIINLADIHAQRPLRHHTVYCMAKAALVMMTRSLAQELAPEVRVNGVAPGAILWPESTEGSDNQQRSAIVAGIPLQRTGTAEDVANTVAYLALDAPYITGQIITVDGGRSL